MDIDLTGKRVVITGGTRGIGRVISINLAKAGARVAAIYRADEEQAQRTLAELNSISFAGHCIIQADIASENEVEEAFKTVSEKFGREVDHLILDAAAGAGGKLTSMTAADWIRPFDVNVHGAFYCVRAASDMLQKGGSIVFISSGAGHDPMEGLSSYGASKAAANHMSQVLAQELGPRGIRVNTVSPGHTDKSGSDPNANPEAYSERQLEIINTTALRRFGTAQDVANVVLFFVSDLSGFVTGQWVRVNGGRL